MLRRPTRHATALTIAGLLGLLAFAVLPVRADTAVSKTLCVGGPGCYQTIQLAVDAAGDGDTVKIGPGTFSGSVTIDKSITVIGAGAARTIVKGGGPVVAIGDLQNVKRVEVTVRGLTVTGGLGVGQPGGVFVGGVDETKAETVATIIDCVIARNRAVSNPQIPKGQGAPTWAAGGGIINVGQLTLIRTTVSDNVAGGDHVTTQAKGGGIWNATAGGPGSLTIRDSRITGNTAIVTSIHAVRAEGGGIEAQDGPTLTITGSVISGNRAILDTHAPSLSADPSNPGVYAAAGGIQIGGLGKATITSTRITGNVANATDPQGNPISFASAILVGGPKEKLVIRDTTITGNRTEANTLEESAPGNNTNCCTGDVLDIDNGGLLSHVTIANNTNIAHVRRGTAVLIGILSVYGTDPKPLVIADSTIAHNTNRLTNTTGTAWAGGGGLTVLGPTTLRGTSVLGNTLTVGGKTGFARGGGIWSGSVNGLKGRLMLTGGTVVSGNVLRGSPGIALEGGGLYAGLPVKIRGAKITGNKPDQCHGC